MSRKPSLAALKRQIEDERRPEALAEAPHATPSPPRGAVAAGRRYPTYREGKVPIGGYFSPELSLALHRIALDESATGQRRVKIQALLGEAIDLLLRDRGKSPFGER